MKRIFINLIEDGENIYLVDKTDYSELQYYYSSTTGSTYDREDYLSLLILTDYDDNILDVRYDNFTENISEEQWECTINIDDDWDNGVVAELYLLPTFKDSSNNYLDACILHDYFVYQKENTNKKLWRLDADPDYDTGYDWNNGDPRENENWSLLYNSGSSDDPVSFIQSDLDGLRRQTKATKITPTKFIQTSIEYANIGLDINPFLPPSPVEEEEINVNFKITKKKCNNYEIASNLTDVTEGSYMIKDEMTKKVIHQKATDYSDFPLEFTVPKDGIYSVNIYYEGDDEEEIEESYIIYEHCEFQECFKKLLKKVYCDDNTCNDFCDKEVQYEKELLKSELTKMSAMFSSLMLAIHGHQFLYLGHNYEDDESFVEYFENIKILWSAMEIIYNRCGSCGERNLSNSNNCNCR